MNISYQDDFYIIKNDSIKIYLSESADPAIKIAAENLIIDLHKSLQIEASLSSQKENCTIRILLEKEQPSYPVLYDQNKHRIWEAYLLKCTNGVLYLTGNGRRGIIYAIYEFSNLLGISPWYFFGDVPPRKRNFFKIENEWSKSDFPSVQYRGIFLNDEEELDAWSKQHTKDGTIGPEIYARIFELLLRLKGNYIWPAMHVNYFNQNPENGFLADRMGIVVGTSHCDMLLRSNQNEWKPWIIQKGYSSLKYDYSIPGLNRKHLQEYWQESVAQNKKYETSYTVGMRGIHDTGFCAERIDRKNISTSRKNKLKVKLIEKIINDQRSILEQTLGTPKENILQVFIPYKEVLPLYDNDMKIPEDITLMWVDDNFGYVRRYPDKAEQKRRGGNALYYHNSYWAHPEMSYLFINTIPMAQTGLELARCYEQNIKKIWVLNVGALKPLEQDIEYFLSCAWDARKHDSYTLHSESFLRDFVNHNFSGNHGDTVSKIYSEFCQTANVCKVEHLQSNIFSQYSYGDEAGLRLWKLKTFSCQIQAIEATLPEDEKSAFFEFFTMKIVAAFLKNAEFYYADRSILCIQHHKNSSADYYSLLTDRMQQNFRYLIYSMSFS